MSVTLDVTAPESFIPVVVGRSRPVWVGNPADHQDTGTPALLVDQDAVLIRAPREFLTGAFDGLTVTISESVVLAVQEIRLIDSARSGTMVSAMLRLASPVDDVESVRFSREDYRRARRHADGDFWSAMRLLGVIPAGWESVRPEVAGRASVAGTCPAVREIRWMDWCTIFWWLC
jgi:hypothetical protein